MMVKRATAKRPDLRFDIANYSSESIGKNSKDCVPVRGQIATNRITNSRCGQNQSQDAVKSTESCLGTHGFIDLFCFDPNIENCKLQNENCKLHDYLVTQIALSHSIYNF